MRYRVVLPVLHVAALLGVLGSAGVAGAQPPDPLGAQFQVNTYTSSNQDYPAVGVDSRGNFVVVWQSNLVPGNDPLGSIQAQRYDSSGNELGGEFQVNTYTTARQRLASVDVNSAGDFVVVWESEGSAGGDTSSWSTQGQRYDSSGVAVGTQFQVNTYTTSDQRRPSVGVDSSGSFVVVWQSDGGMGTDALDFSIQGQRYDSTGSAIGSEFQVNSYTTGLQRYPDVGIDADGEFVVVWNSGGSPGTDSSSYSIQAQRYDADGNAIGAQFQVNTYTTAAQGIPRVDVDSRGGFVVVWDGAGSAGNDSSSYSSHGQRYHASGSPIGSEFQVNTYTTGFQQRPSVSAAANGDFVVVWWGSYAGSDYLLSIQGQRYDSTGSAIGAEFQVNSYTTSVQQFPWVGTEPGGDFVVVWASDGSLGNDSRGQSIQGQRYAPEPGSLLLQAAAIGSIGLLARKRARHPSRLQGRS